MKYVVAIVACSTIFMKNYTKQEMIRKIDERNFWTFTEEGKDQNTQILHVARNLKNEDLLQASQKVKFNKNICDDWYKILVISNYGTKSSGKIRLVLIWEELLRLASDLSTFIWED